MEVGSLVKGACGVVVDFRQRTTLLASPSTLFLEAAAESRCVEKQSLSLKNRAPILLYLGCICPANRLFTRSLKIWWNQWCLSRGACALFQIRTRIRNRWSAFKARGVTG